MPTAPSSQDRNDRQRERGRQGRPSPQRDNRRERSASPRRRNDSTRRPRSSVRHSEERDTDREEQPREEQREAEEVNQEQRLVKRRVARIVKALDQSAKKQRYFHSSYHDRFSDLSNNDRLCKPLAKIHEAARWLCRLLGPVPEYNTILLLGSRLVADDLGLRAFSVEENADLVE